MIPNLSCPTVHSSLMAFKYKTPQWGDNWNLNKLNLTGTVSAFGNKKYIIV